jgi:hypothetical protein
MKLHKFLHNLLNVRVQIANKMGLQKKLLEAELTVVARVLPEGVGRLKNASDLIMTRIRDFPTCNTKPQPSTLPRAHIIMGSIN